MLISDKQIFDALMDGKAVRRQLGKISHTDLTLSRLRPIVT